MVRPDSAASTYREGNAGPPRSGLPQRGCTSGQSGSHAEKRDTTVVEPRWGSSRFDTQGAASADALFYFDAVGVNSGVNDLLRTKAYNDSAGAILLDGSRRGVLPVGSSTKKVWLCRFTGGEHDSYHGRQSRGARDPWLHTPA